MSLILALLDNPAVLNFLFTALVAGLVWGGRKVLRLVDTKWANEFLAGVGAHMDLAIRAATAEYVRRIDLADDDGVVTTDERKAARKAALDAAMAEIGLSKVMKALGLSRGSKTDADAARAFIERGLDSKLAELGLAAPVVEESDEPDPFDETAPTSKL